MAQRKISGNDVLLFLSRDGVTYSTVVCLTSQTVTRTTNEIEANTKCGPDKLPGVQSNDVSFEGQVLIDPNSGTVSTDELDDLWRNKDSIWWKMGKQTPLLGDYTYYGTGFISELVETYGQDAPSTFTGKIAPSGIINKTTATS